ncbi:MAG: polymerase-associated protein RapA [Pseudomonadota bacterium]|jgi:hypothetical protein
MKESKSALIEWKKLLARGLSLHGFLESEGRGSLVLVPYWDCTDESAGVSAASDLQVKNFFNNFVSKFYMNPKNCTVALPAVIGSVPLPAPIALSLSRGEKALKRISAMTRREIRHSTFKLKGQFFPLESVFSIARLFCELELAVPGGLTPTFYDLLSSFLDLEVEVRDCIQNGNEVPLSDFEVNKFFEHGANFKGAAVPKIADVRKQLRDRNKSALEIPSDYLANLSYARCWHWLSLISLLSNRCSPRVGGDREVKLQIAMTTNLVLISSRAFYHSEDIDVDPEGFSPNHPLRARASNTGILSFLSILDSTRPLTPHLAFLLDKDTTQVERNLSSVERLRLRPAVFKPKFHEQSKKAKKIDRSCLVPFEDLIARTEGNPLTLEEGLEVFPADRFWLTFDAIRLIQVFPEFFLNFTFFRNGYFACERDAAEKVKQRLTKKCKDFLNEFSKYGIDRDGPRLFCSDFMRDVGEVQKGLYLTPVLVRHPNVERATGHWWDRTSFSSVFGSGELEVEWLDWVAKPNIHLGVTWDIDPDSPVSPWIRQLIENSKSGNSIASEAMTDESISNLFFRPRPWFSVNGKEISFEVWSQAKKVKDHFLLSGGEKIASEDYEKYTRHFIARQKTYARMGRVSLSSLWSSHVASAGSGELLSPTEYLSDLEMRISPIYNLISGELEKRALEKLDSLSLLGLKADLRPYQKIGVSILCARTSAGINVCLADEMGLGKTLQTICFLMIKMYAHPDWRALIVVPKSLIRNWQREIEKFAPSLKVALWGAHDTDSKIILSAYARVRIDIEKICKCKFGFVVLDEAHTIKNADTQISQAVRRISTQTRLAITGTPVENRAEELWNVIDWLNPGYLGHRASFVQYISSARSFADRMLALKPLHAALQPVMLRRLKSSPDVSLNLPEKILEEHYFDLSEEQESLYRAILESTISDGDAVVGALARRALYLKALMHLKQVCDHPALFLGPSSNKWLDDFVADVDATFSEKALRRLNAIAEKSELSRKKHMGFLDLQRERSGKIGAFLDLLEELRIQAAGIVVFTQFVDMGHTLVDTLRELDDASWGHVPFLHGGLAADVRMALVDQFQLSCSKYEIDKSGAPPILIASLKAGGLGLTLTGADHVIHFDRWWNPAVEDQASDRLHRFGQKRSVTVHTFVGEQTLEESISKLLEEKRSLAQDLLGLGVAAVESVGQTAGEERTFIKFVDPSGRFSR